MSDDHSEKPDPIEDVRKGLGLLFRAAKSTLEQLPTRSLEEAVVSGAREVGRAIENVTGAIDKQLFKRDSAGAPETPAESPAEASGEHKPEADDSPPAATPKDEPRSPEDQPKGPRVG